MGNVTRPRHTTTKSELSFLSTIDDFSRSLESSTDVMAFLDSRSRAQMVSDHLGMKLSSLLTPPHPIEIFPSFDIPSGWDVEHGSYSFFNMRYGFIS
ncbi:hypothetical protein M427DRAFT_457787 [Gonapodya prolifera JEL478]|uniref:Uncharacterized protein n=1 Tax=Gonapodya prolifera (strain JEL478) TaxID=1344416 RepID=A0A139A2J4_GONPJ|nr:hypothetical protein M427DRAFT_457787 [Gonapodya prolifera JEL478]|eukprot:KXS10971.1 hypothetical protein M427DRAFT_457787 [Gonapodya prolifera JEL478]